MIVNYKKLFLKAIDNLTDEKVKAKIKDVIFEVKEAKSISQINNLKKLSGYKHFYRIRIGNYRIGVFVEPKIRKELIYCEHKSLQISRFAKLASFTVAGAMPQSANLLISCALHSHNDTSLRNLGGG